MQRVICYARVARADQVALTKQLEEINQYTSAQDYDVLAIIADNGVSGLNNQKSIATLRRLAESEHPDALVCTTSCRISRNPVCLLQLHSELEKLGTRIEFTRPDQNFSLKKDSVEACLLHGSMVTLTQQMTRRHPR